MMINILRDSLWQGVAAIFAIIIGVIAFFPESAKCQEAIYEVVEDAELCGSIEETVVLIPEMAKSCRTRAFGIELYSQSKEIRKTSGWMRGGSNPTNWCNSLIAGEIRARGIGDTAKSDVIRKSEDARWTGTFGRTREYNYDCTIKLSWDPVYFEKQDLSCGMIAAVTRKNIIPKKCKKQVAVKEVACPDE